MWGVPAATIRDSQGNFPPSRRTPSIFFSSKRTKHQRITSRTVLGGGRKNKEMPAMDLYPNVRNPGDDTEEGSVSASRAPHHHIGGAVKPNNKPSSPNSRMRSFASLHATPFLLSAIGLPRYVSFRRKRFLLSARCLLRDEGSCLLSHPAFVLFCCETVGVICASHAGTRQRRNGRFRGVEHSDPVFRNLPAPHVAL